MSWTNKKVNSKTPPWIYRQSQNKYHNDPIGEESYKFSRQIQENLPNNIKNEKTK
jgi:hypothetical protein